MLDLIRENRIQEAISEGNGRLKKNPQDHDARYALGIAYLVSGNLTDSIKALKKVLEKRPEDFKCAGNLGAAYLRDQNYEQAILILQAALHIQPNYTDARYNLACAYLANKQSAEALEAFELLHTQFPDSPEYLCALGDAHRESGQWARATKCYEKALEIADGFYRAHLNLGALLLHSGQFLEAEKHCKAAVSLEPKDAKAHKNYGDCLVRLEMLDEAMESYADAYELHTDSADLSIAIGKVWQEIGEMQEASSWFNKAIVLEPDNTTAKCYLGAIIADALDPDAALKILEPLLEAEPDHIELCLTVSGIYWDNGDADLAMRQLRHVQQIQPHRLDVLIKIANILSSSGDVDGAVNLYHEALAKNPHFVPALNGLATTLKSKLDTSQVALIESLLSDDPHIKSGKAAALYSALAFYYDAGRDAEKASAHMQKANKHQWEFRSKRDWRYEPENHEQMVSAMIETFSPTYFEEYGQIGHQDVSPIFIVAMPRSGTTLTEQILARHSKVLGVGERPFASQSFQAFCAGFNPADSSDYIQRLNPEHLHQAAEQYLNSLQLLIEKSSKSGVEYVVDKMPDNYSLIGWILTLFPNAKIIHAARDSRDVALSCWLTQFGSIPWASNTDHLVKRIEQYQRMMSHWRSVLGSRIYESNYEDLVANQEIRSREMINFIGLEWEEECLSFYESDRLVRTASITQVRQPIYSKSVAKWQHYKPYIPELLDMLSP